MNLKRAYITIIVFIIIIAIVLSLPKVGQDTRNLEQAFVGHWINVDSRSKIAERTVDHIFVDGTKIIEVSSTSVNLLTDRDGNKPERKTSKYEVDSVDEDSGVLEIFILPYGPKQFIRFSEDRKTFHYVSNNKPVSNAWSYVNGDTKPGSR